MHSSNTNAGDILTALNNVNVQIVSSAKNTPMVIDVESHLKVDVSAFDHNWRIRS